MLIHQISVFVENKQGRLREVMDVIAGAGIDIRALSLADTSDFGILRMIVDDPGKAAALFRENGIMASVTEVIAAELDDKPGALAHVLSVLAGVDISVEYIYAFITRRDQNAYVILRVEDNEAAAGALTKANISLLSPDEIYSI